MPLHLSCRAELPPAPLLQAESQANTRRDVHENPNCTHLEPWRRQLHSENLDGVE